MTNLDCVLKSKDITLSAMVPVVKAVVFPVVTYGCESWTVKMSEAKEFWNCGAGEDSSESLETARRSNQSILKEINPEDSLEGLTL